MLGSEGRLGHWDMPEAEADIDQKNHDNAKTLANTLRSMKTYRELAEQYPDQNIIYRMKTTGERLTADEQVLNVWAGVISGVVSEMADEGLDEVARRILNGTEE